MDIGVNFLNHKPLMQALPINKFPILLIDESQDTNKALMEALLAVQAKQKHSFALGLLGDTMQRIYADGKSDLGQNVPTNWAKPVKKNESPFFEADHQAHQQNSIGAESRSYLSSAPPDQDTPAQWLELIRGHWGGVAIRHHWRRDALMGADRSRGRHPHLLANLALLRSALL
jgi:hypothetical protein